MQSSDELDQQLQLIKRASQSKPWGFALIPVSEDGTPVLLIEKKESQARRMGKAELKTAKKKKIYTGLIYLEGGKIALKESSKPLKPAEMKKFFKKLKNKAGSRKSLIPSDIVITPSDSSAGVQDKDLDTADISESSSVHANPKYLDILEKLRAQRDDLEGDLSDISDLFENVTMVFQQPDNEVSDEDESSLTDIGTKVPTLSNQLNSLNKNLDKLEELINLNEKSEIKTLGKDIRAELGEVEKELVGIQSTLEGFSVTDMDNKKTAIADVSTIAYILNQAKALRASRTVRGLIKNNKKPGFFDRLFASRYNDIIKLSEKLDKLIAKLESLADKEEKGEAVTSSDEKKAKSKLTELQKLVIRLGVAGKVSKQTPISEKIDIIWKPAHRQAQLEVQRFKMAVFSNPVVVADPRFSVIKNVLASTNLTLDLPPVQDEEALKKAISNVKNSDEYKIWKKVDSSSWFGSFSITSTLEQALSSLLP